MPLPEITLTYSDEITTVDGLNEGAIRTELRMGEVVRAEATKIIGVPFAMACIYIKDRLVSVHTVEPTSPLTISAISLAEIKARIEMRRAYRVYLATDPR